MNEPRSPELTGSVDAVPSMAARWYVLIVMVLVYTMSIADRYAISTVQESIRLELHLTDSGIASLTGVSLGLFYVTFGFPIAWLIDRSHRRNIIAASVAAWSAMTVLCGLARNYTQLLVSRIGVGVGEAGGTPGANSILSDYFPAERRPMALTIFGLGAPIGAWLAADFAGAIADHYGWRAVFLALGVPGALLAALIFFTIREPRRGRFDAEANDSTAGLGESMRFLWKQRSAVHVMMGSALTALWGWGLMWWTPTFLMRTYGLTTGEAGAIIGPINLWAGIGATLADGLAAGAAAPCLIRGASCGCWAVSSVSSPCLRSSSTRPTPCRWRRQCSGSSSRRSTSTSGPVSACSIISPSRACAPCSARPRCSWPTSAT